MDDATFRKRADEALESLYQALTRASEHYGFEPDFNAGALSIEFDDPPARFVVSPNSPVRQIWVSANVRSFKLDFDSASNQFILPATGQSLTALIAEQITHHLGGNVDL